MTNSLKDYISYDPVLDEVIYNGDVASNSLLGQSFEVEFLLRNQEGRVFSVFQVLIFQQDFDLNEDASALDPIDDTIDTAPSEESSFEEKDQADDKNEAGEELVIYVNPKYIIDDSYDASLAPKDGIAFYNEILLR